MATSTAIASDTDVRAFIDEYFKAWEGTDEKRILSFYAETVSLEDPGHAYEWKGGTQRSICPPLYRWLSWESSHREEHDFREKHGGRRMEFRSRSQRGFR